MEDSCIDQFIRKRNQKCFASIHCSSGFSLMMADQRPTLDEVQLDIIKYQAKYDQLLIGQKSLSKAKDDQQNMTERFKSQRDKICKSLEEDRCSHARTVDIQRAKLTALQQQESTLRTELYTADVELRDLVESNESLMLQMDVSNAVPEKEVVFAGGTGAVTGSKSSFATKARIIYPMEGGTALMTFEDPLVAKEILRLREHRVDLGEEGEEAMCYLSLEAKPVLFLMPRCLEIDTHVCPRRILVSNLPKHTKEDVENLLDKLEIYFSKKCNGGGEVQDREMLHDSGNAIITFVETGVANNLTHKELPFHNVEFGKAKKSKVKVTPFLNGEITDFQTTMSQCDSTVLLTGIPAVMDQGDMADQLEIHFQKSCNGGGEISSFLYNPLGQQAMAVFEEDCPTKERSSL